MRQQQHKCVNMATYKLLRSIDENMEDVDMTTRKYSLESLHFTLNLWNYTSPPISVACAKKPK